MFSDVFSQIYCVALKMEMFAFILAHFSLFVRQIVAQNFLLIIIDFSWSVFDSCTLWFKILWKILIWTGDSFVFFPSPVNLHCCSNAWQRFSCLFTLHCLNYSYDADWKALLKAYEFIPLHAVKVTEIVLVCMNCEDSWQQHKFLFSRRRTCYENHVKSQFNAQLKKGTLKTEAWRPVTCHFTGLTPVQGQMRMFRFENIWWLQ